jgi:hypothetical protein
VLNGGPARILKSILQGGQYSNLRFATVGHQKLITSQILGYNSSPHLVSLLLALDCFFGQVFFKKNKGQPKCTP